MSQMSFPCVINAFPSVINELTGVLNAFPSVINELTGVLNAFQCVINECVPNELPCVILIND